MSIDQFLRDHGITDSYEVETIKRMFKSGRGRVRIINTGSNKDGYG